MSSPLHRVSLLPSALVVVMALQGCTESEKTPAQNTDGPVVTGFQIDDTTTGDDAGDDGSTDTGSNDDGGDGSGDDGGGDGSGDTSGDDGGEAGGDDGEEADPCPDDMICVDAFPFEETTTTTRAARDDFDGPHEVLIVTVLGEEFADAAQALRLAVRFVGRAARAPLRRHGAWVTTTPVDRTRTRAWTA